MKKSKFRRAFFLTTGMLCIMGGVGLGVYNLWDDSRASSDARRVVYAINEMASQHETSGGAAGIGEPSETVVVSEDTEREMPTVLIDRYEYIGTVSIVSLGLELPIMEEWDYTRMKISPCRYSGSVYRNDMIVCGHNYRSHFGLLNTLQIFDEIVFTDVEGTEFRYRIVQIEELPGTAVEEMSAGEWDFTLFTCTLGGKSRVTVRCESVE